MTPCSLVFEGLPASSTTATLTPGSGREPEPGLKVVSVCRGEIMVAPVSDCHHVSTIGTPSGVSRPMWVRAHCHASGLTASPTVPINRIDDRSYSADGPFSCLPINDRNNVGAV